MIRAETRFQRGIALFLGALLMVVLPSACSGLMPNQPAPPAPENGRLVAHAMGETVVPQAPQRVVVLGTVVDVLALGIHPVGASTLGLAQRDGAGELPSFLGAAVDDIVRVGHTAQPDLETITRLEPDLILGAKGIHGGIYRQLTQIAPTVVIDISAGADAWKDYFVTAAEALGRADQAQALLTQYQQRVATFQQVMGPRLTTTEVSVARFRPDGFRAYMRGSFSGAVLAEVGLARPANQGQDKAFENLSLEQISRIDGDVLFVMQDNADNSTFNRVQESPLWSQLHAVQQGRVHEISLESWFLNPGIVGANLILNDLFRYLGPDGDRDIVRQVGELALQS